MLTSGKRSISRKATFLVLHFVKVALLQGRIQNFANKGNMLADAYCDITLINENDINVDFSVGIACVQMLTQLLEYC